MCERTRSRASVGLVLYNTQVHEHKQVYVRQIIYAPALHTLADPHYRSKSYHPVYNYCLACEICSDLWHGSRRHYDVLGTNSSSSSVWRLDSAVVKTRLVSVTSTILELNDLFHSVASEEFLEDSAEEGNGSYVAVLFKTILSTILYVYCHYNCSFIDELDKALGFSRIYDHFRGLPGLPSQELRTLVTILWVLCSLYPICNDCIIITAFKVQWKCVKTKANKQIYSFSQDFKAIM